jgi:hypothetical protein
VIADGLRPIVAVLARSPIPLATTPAADGPTMPRRGDGASVTGTGCGRTRYVSGDEEGTGVSDAERETNRCEEGLRCFESLWRAAQRETGGIERELIFYPFFYRFCPQSVFGDVHVRVFGRCSVYSDGYLAERPAGSAVPLPPGAPYPYASPNTL